MSPTPSPQTRHPSLRQRIEKRIYGDFLETEALVDQTFVALDAQYLQVKARPDFQSLSPVYVSRVETLLASPRSWASANALELHMLPLLPDAELAVLIERKLVAARTQLAPDVIAFYESALQEAARPEREAVARRLLRDVHWYYEVRQQRRYLEAKAILRRCSVFIAFFFIFFSPALFPAFAEALLHVNSNRKMYYTVTALSAGGLGASFSMLIGMNGHFEGLKLDAIKLMCRYSYILMRVFVGVGAGLVFMYFLQAGLMEGSFLPDLSAMASSLELKDHALLVIWCIIAGFSEKLVPSVIARVESSVDRAAQTRA